MRLNDWVNQPVDEKTDDDIGKLIQLLRENKTKSERVLRDMDFENGRV